MAEKLYAPQLNVACPTDDSTLFRTFSADNTNLNPREESYIKSRAEKVVSSWNDWIDGSDVNYNMSLFNDKYPTVAFSYSGGSLRALLWVAGVSNAYDARNETARKLGTGGFYNVASYVTSLSGGSWASASASFSNQSTTFPELVSSWLLDLDLIQPSGDLVGFFARVAKAFGAKAATGIPTSLADLWANILSPRFLPGTDLKDFFDDSAHGAGILLSDLVSQDQYKNAEIPFPIMVTCSRSGTETSVSTSDVVYEMTPVEFGSYDPPLAAMINMKFVGTTLNEGKPLNSSSCVTAFDQASFCFATSSDIFDEESDLQFIVNAIDTIDPNLESGGDGFIQALWPNPFKGINPDTYLDSNTSVLRLDDGSENHDNVPVEPVLVRARGVDVVVIADATSETTLGQKNNYPNGTSLQFAERRLQGLLAANHQPLPEMPDDFAATGVNLAVTFFGCDPKQNPAEFPLVIYVPNSPPCTGDDPVTNTPSTQTQYSQLHQDRFLNQAFLGATCGFLPNATGIDTNFPVCLKCAAIDRARLFADPVIPRSSECQSCFDKYCFNPADPPSNSDFPGRKFLFVDPNSTESFVQKHVVLIAVLCGVIGGLLVLAWCFCTCWCIARNRRRRRIF